MRITLSEDEIVEMLKRELPVAVGFAGMAIKEIETRGYPLKELVITIDKKEGEDGAV